MSQPGAIVLGAGPAGLAVAGCLKAARIEPLLIERSSAVGAVWRRHYDRLHLHTDRGHSALPGLPMPRRFPRYPERAQVVEYLESYARRFDLRPLFDTAAARALRDGGGWRIETDNGVFRAPAIVVATGFAGWPHRPSWPGLDGFGGDVRHSSDYRNAAPYAGKRVLVVGLGNSGGEIALDLAEAGVSVAIAVRGPVNILPRDLLGMPILSWSIAMRSLPPRLADILSAPLVRLAVGSLARLGLTRAATGPLADIRGKGRIPLLDIGTVAKIREGKIAVRPGLRAFVGRMVEFDGGTRESFDAVILATGYRPDLRPLLPDATGTLDGDGLPKISGGPTAYPGLYFCGYFISPTGQLREIGLEARRIAAHIAEASRASILRGPPNGAAASG